MTDCVPTLPYLTYLTFPTYLIYLSTSNYSTLEEGKTYEVTYRVFWGGGGMGTNEKGHFIHSLLWKGMRYEV